MVPVCQKTELFLDGEGCYRVSTGHWGHPGLEPRTHAHGPEGIPMKPLHKGSLIPTLILSNKMSVPFPACPLTRSCTTLCDLTDCGLPGSSVHGISQARIFEWVPFPSPGDLPDPGIDPASPALAGGFFTAEPEGKPLSTHYQLKCCKNAGHHQFLLPVLQPWHGENNSTVLIEQRVMKSPHRQHCGVAVLPSFSLTETRFVSFTIPPSKRKVNVKVA